MTTVSIVKNGGTLETSIRESPPYQPPCKSSSTGKLQGYKNSDGNKLNTI
ncbi:hypothetical protein CFP56_026949 [Quercus suber]|uniref:Uncharacterized protein n=1 Tax=Quercus suber TaxID=58331 RepID=A0AAW0LY38_QUESU